MNKLTKSGLLVAGPTSGKTTLIRDLRQKGIEVADTDEICDEIYPWYHDLKPYRRDTPDAHWLGVLVRQGLGRVVFDRGYKTVVTNLWGSEFLDPALGVSANTGKGWIYIGRANPLEITELSRTRGGSVIPTALTAKWTNSAERDSHKCFDHVLWLPKSVYLSQVVKLTPKGWTLTKLGEELIDKPRTYALHYKEDQGSSQVKEGPQDVK